MHTTDRLLFPNLSPSFTTAVQSRFGDFDMFGHVNNNAMMAYFDLGKTDFFNRLVGARVQPVNLAVAIVHIEVDFLAPALSSEPLEVITAVVEVGEKSFRLYQRVRCTTTGAVKAQAFSVLAGFDVTTQAGAPLDDQLRRKLLEEYSRHFAD